MNIFNLTAIVDAIAAGRNRKCAACRHVQPVPREQRGQSVICRGCGRSIPPPERGAPRKRR